MCCLVFTIHWPLLTQIDWSEDGVILDGGSCAATPSSFIIRVRIRVAESWDSGSQDCTKLVFVVVVITVFSVIITVVVEVITVVVVILVILVVIVSYHHCQTRNLYSTDDAVLSSCQV